MADKPKAAPPTTGDVALLLAAVAGVLVGAAAMGLGGYVQYQKKVAQLRKGWNLIPVMVADADIEAGQIVHFDYLSQRSIPAQFITDSVVLPEKAWHVTQMRATVPIHKGDPILWTSVTTATEADITECRQRLQQKAP